MTDLEGSMARHPAGKRRVSPDVELPRCACDWKFHRGQVCGRDVPDDGSGVISSPVLCVPCLFVCCGERDDEQGGF